MTILPKSKKFVSKDRDRGSANSSGPTASCSNDRQRAMGRKLRKPHSEAQSSQLGMPPHKKSALRSRSQSPGVNSDDERRSTSSRNDQLEAEFSEQLRTSRGFQVKEMGEDGACLFRAVADQVYGDQEMHGEVRRLCMDYMERNQDHFAPFITEDFKEYIARKRLSTTHGNHAEIQSISEMYARPVEVYEYSQEPINTFHPSDSAGVNAPLRLSYHRSSHYNSVVDPLSATIGVGLGLPGLVPGAADAQLIADAVRQSETMHLEETMLNDKMHMSDWQRTELELKEQVARESYMDYVRSIEKGNDRRGTNQRDKQSPTRVALDKPCGSRSMFSSDTGPRDVDQPCSSKQSGLYEELLAIGATDWSGSSSAGQEEDSLIAQAMLLSQQQFMEDLQKKSDCPGSSHQ